MQKGFLVTRGLGFSRVLVTRGLGSYTRLQVTLDRPRQLRVRGGSGRREEKTEKIDIVFVNARLVVVNNVTLPIPVEGTIKVNHSRGETFRVRTAMPTVKTKKRKIVIFARYIRDPEF